MSPPKPAERLWAGRFAAGPAAIMDAINVSIGFDQRLGLEDLQGSIAHCRMLAATQILSAADAAAILDGLEQIGRELADGRFPFDPAHEDIHLNIEARLKTLIGAPAGRLHTARSRNDQVATSFRLWLRQALTRLDSAAKALQAALVTRAEAEAASIMPGFTHLQMAQPVTLGHHLLAYVEMLGRDRGRLRDAMRRMNESPLGSAALAGTPWPIDREQTAAALGFDRPTANSLDAVSDRDFAVEALAALAILQMHLSRLAEEIVLWVTPQFGFIRLPDDLTTGSSIMPQKRNPDAAELIRGKTGRVFGHLLGLLTMLKGLPLAYSKDMQEDKEPIFDAVDTLDLSLAAMQAMIAGMRVDRARMRAAALPGHPTATDLADWLVRALDIPFREAHHLTGRIVAEADRRGCDLAELPLDVLQAIEPRITAEVPGLLTLEASVAARCSLGGTAPERVLAAAAEARRRFDL